MTKSKSKVKTPKKQKKPQTEAEKKAAAEKRAAHAAARSAANTRAQAYLSVFREAESCAANKKKIADKCKPKEDKPDDPSKKPKKKNLLTEIVGKAAHVVDDAAKKLYKLAGAKTNDDNAWMDDHCAGLWIKPTTLNTEHYAKEFEDGLDTLKNSKMEMIGNAASRLIEVAKEKLGPEVVAEKLGGLAVRSVLKEGAATVTGATGIGLVVSAGLTAWTAVDAYNTAMDLAEAVGPEGLEIAAEITSLKSITDKLDALAAKYKTSPMAAVADSQYLIAELNACVRARRCQLVPYNETTPALKAAKNGKGCCPGQTGHHLLPNEMFKDCPAYTQQMHDMAPTVCAEGVNNTHGSHGNIHTSIDKLMQKRQLKSDSITTKDAIDDAVKSHEMTFPGCNAKCLEEQLNAFYKDLCEGKMKPRGGLGNKSTDGEEATEDDVVDGSAK
jgi:hypothetical protein